MEAFRERFSLALLFLVLGEVLVVGALLAVRAQAGQLDPTAPPGSTMTSLDLLAGRWARELDSTNGAGAGCNSDRFQCTFYTRRFPELNVTPKAVLDRGTGLVWERSPSSSVYSWYDALQSCYTKSAGNRLGWRPPSVAEMQSLFDVSADALPDNHPFIFSPSIPTELWTATTNRNANATWITSADPATTNSGPKSGTRAIWCVRGSGGYDAPGVPL